MIGWLLALHFRILDGIHVLPEEVMTDGGLNLGGGQMLGSHRPRPGLVNDFLNKSKYMS